MVEEGVLDEWEPHLRDITDCLTLFKWAKIRGKEAAANWTCALIIVCS